MKFLFDQSADFRLIPHLTGLGHDVQAISRNYPHGLPDDDVLEIARNEKRILIVADRDFGELIFQQELAHAGVIFFRLPESALLGGSLTCFWVEDPGQIHVLLGGQPYRDKYIHRLHAKPPYNAIGQVPTLQTTPPVRPDPACTTPDRQTTESHTSPAAALSRTVTSRERTGGLDCISVIPRPSTSNLAIGYCL